MNRTLTRNPTLTARRWLDGYVCRKCDKYNVNEERDVSQRNVRGSQMAPNTTSILIDWHRDSYLLVDMEFIWRVTSGVGGSTDLEVRSRFPSFPPPPRWMLTFEMGIPFFSSFRCFWRCRRRRRRCSSSVSSTSFRDPFMVIVLLVAIVVVVSPPLCIFFFHWLCIMLAASFFFCFLEAFFDMVLR